MYVIDDLPEFKYEPDEKRRTNYDLGGSGIQAEDWRIPGLSDKRFSDFPTFSYSPAGPLGAPELPKGFDPTHLLPYLALGLLPLSAFLAGGSSEEPPFPVHAPRKRPVPYKHVPSWLTVSQMPQSLGRGETQASYFWPGSR